MPNLPDEADFEDPDLEMPYSTGPENTNPFIRRIENEVMQISRSDCLLRIDRGRSGLVAFWDVNSLRFDGDAR
jgi:hypothetical protein